MLTHESNSYFTSEFKISKPVAEKATHFLPFPITHSKRIKTKTSMHGAVVGGLTMATDLLSGRPRWRFPSAEDAQEWKTKYFQIENSMLRRLDHIRDKASDPAWYNSFLATMDTDVKIDTLAACVLMNVQQRQAGENELVLGTDVLYARINAFALWVRSQYPDPVAALIGMTAPDGATPDERTP